MRAFPSDPLEQAIFISGHEAFLNRLERRLAKERKKIDDLTEHLAITRDVIRAWYKYYLENQ